MPSVLVTVRFPARLSVALDRVAARGKSSPSHLVDRLAAASQMHQEAILKGPVEGPFADKRNFRLRPETVGELQRLGGAAGAPEFLRRMVGFFFARPQVLRSVVANLPDPSEWPLLFEEEERPARAPRPS